MIRKIVCLAMAAIMALLMAACGGNGDPVTDPAVTDPNDPHGDNASATELVVADGGNALYTVVLPKGCSAAVSAASTKLVNAVKEISGAKPERVYDTSTAEREILLGLTNREASKTAKNDIGAGEYVIKADGERIVILAANELYLDEAVEKFAATLQNNGGRLTLPKSTLLYERAETPAVPLFSAGKFHYTVIYENGLDTETTDKIDEFVKKTKDLLGADAISVKRDTATTAKDENREILVGNTNRTQSAEAYKKLSALGYRIAVDGKKITLAATGKAKIMEALNALYGEIAAAKKAALVGPVLLGEGVISESADTVFSKAWFQSVPALESGNLTSGYSADADSCVLERENTTAADYAAYVTALEQAGFTGGDNYEMGGNRYALRYGKEATAFVSYSDKAKTIRLYVEKKGNYTYPERGEASDAGTTPVLWQLPVDCKNSKANGGMSYVLRLANGHFFLFDGGYDTKDEADNLYHFLVSKTPAGEKPVIDGWFISHLHGDHYGGLIAFSTLYADRVDVKAFYYHFNLVGGTLKTAMDRWSGAVHYGRLHTGMEFNLPGANFQVLYTMEDLYPRVPTTDYDFNNTSTCLRLTVKGTRVVFLGDQMKKGSDCMMKYLPGEALKADVVQYAHHGYEGGTRALYNAIAAPVVLWPMNVVGWQETGYATIPQNVFDVWHKKEATVYDNGEAYQIQNYYISYSATFVKQILVAGMGVAEINFPYVVPAGATRLPDYKTYYNNYVAANP